jgi:hypothetical protein
MAMYNQAFDLYHGIYRALHILKRFQNNEVLELDRFRIWDFYLLFPYKTYEIRLSREHKEIASFRKIYIKKEANPYDSVYDGRKLLERLRPYQIGALSCLASYGIINADKLLNNLIEITDRSKLIALTQNLANLPNEENNVLSWLCTFFRTFPLNGNTGLKSRTNLLISKYDGI